MQFEVTDLTSIDDQYVVSCLVSHRPSVKLKLIVLFGIESALRQFGGGCKTDETATAPIQSAVSASCLCTPISITSLYYRQGWALIVFSDNSRLNESEKTPWWLQHQFGLRKLTRKACSADHGCITCFAPKVLYDLSTHDWKARYVDMMMMGDVDDHANKSLTQHPQVNCD